MPAYAGMTNRVVFAKVENAVAPAQAGAQSDTSRAAHKGNHVAVHTIAVVTGSVPVASAHATNLVIVHRQAHQRGSQPAGH
jgi:hypothetical protein